MSTLEKLREAGIAMGTIYDRLNLAVGYTTDPEKAEQAAALGARTIRCGGSFSSWEINAKIRDDA